MNKYSNIFYNYIYPNYITFFNTNNNITFNKLKYKDILEDHSYSFRFFSDLFGDINNFNNDMTIFTYFCNNKNDDIFRDHSTALRCKRIIYLKILKNIPINIINKIDILLSIHFDCLTYDGFINKNSNHGFDQLYSIYLYNKHIKPLSNFEYYNNIMIEYIKNVYHYSVHKENTPEYHYYSLVQFKDFLYLIPSIQDVLKYFYLTFSPELKIINIGDGSNLELIEINSLSNIIDNKVVENLKKNYYSVYSGINYFKSGHLIIKFQDIYFFIKSSLKHSWHHHYDNNSFILFYKGINFFIDSGMYSYDYESFGRKYVVSPNAHNLFILKDDRILKKKINYNCSSLIIDNNTYSFTTEYYDNIIYTRTVNYDNNKIFTFNDKITNIPSEYEEYYILFHLNKETKCIIKKTDIFLSINTTKIKLSSINNINLQSINYCENGVFDNINVGYNSPTKNTLIMVPTIIFKFKNIFKDNLNTFKIFLL